MLEKQMCQSNPIQRRPQILKDSCRKMVENEDYVREMTPEELDESKNELVEKQSEINILKNELKEISQNYKKKLKDLESRRNDLVSQCQFKHVSLKGDLYMFDDQESGMMGYYDNDGILVKQRPLKSDERQTSIFTIQRNGTEG